MKVFKFWKKVQSSQARNMEGDYGLYNLVYSLLKLESMECKCEHFYKRERIAIKVKLLSSVFLCHAENNVKQALHLL